MDARRGDRAAAQAVWDAAASGYGPDGAWTLSGDEVLTGSGAVRLQEGAAVAPYRLLVEEVACHGGHATLAALLASRVVLRSLDAPGRFRQRLDGVVLARRQVLAWLSAQAVAAAPAALLGPLDPRTGPEAPPGDAGSARSAGEGRVPHSDDEASALLEGLQALGPHRDLELVDVRLGPVDRPTWSAGVLLEPLHAPSSAQVRGRVLVVGDLMEAPRQSVAVRAAAPGALEALRHREAQAVRQLVDRLSHAGVAVVVCRKGSAEVAETLARHGLVVVTDAPLSLARRVAVATGARPVARVADLDEGHGAAGAAGRTEPDEDPLGDGRAWRRPRRHGGWLLEGAGPSATLEVPGAGHWGQARVAQAERWLRAAGPVLEDPRGVPGAGVWQAQAAAALRRMADHAPGTASLGIHAVAGALDDVWRCLARNAGQDPTRVVPPIRPTRHGSRTLHLDPFPCTRVAVAAALETAIQVLRVDARLHKPPSTPRALRGGDRIGSPRNMPGDVPPLM